MSFYQHHPQRQQGQQQETIMVFGDENADPSFRSSGYRSGVMSARDYSMQRGEKRHSSRPPPPPPSRGRGVMETPQPMSHVQHFEGARYQRAHPAIREDDENEAPTDSDTSLLSVSGDEAGPVVFHARGGGGGGEGGKRTASATSRNHTASRKSKKSKKSSSSRRGATKFVDEVSTEEAVTAKAGGARMTRSKQRELESLRAQHEEMVATMHETAARRDAASKQLISHYKGEAERLLTMTQKSKSVAKSNRADMMERENHKLKQRVLDLEEKLLQAEMERAVGTGGRATGTSAGGTASRQQKQQQQWGERPGNTYASEEDALLGNTGGSGSGLNFQGTAAADQAKEMRMLKKIGRAYQMVTGLKLTITPDQRLVAEIASDPQQQGASAVPRVMKFELDIDEETDEVEYQPVQIQGIPGHLLPDFLRDTITFGSGQTPALFHKALTAVIQSKQ